MSNPLVKIAWMPPASLRVWMAPGRALTSFAAFQSAAGPSIAVCGPMFGDSGEIESRLVDRSAQIAEPGRIPDQGVTFSIVGGIVRVGINNSVAPGASVAVQCRPTLVKDGVAQGFTSASSQESQWRTALLVTRDGRLGAAIGQGTLGQFAQALVHEGAMTAGYLDGGREAALYADGRMTGPSAQSGVPVWLYVAGGSFGGSAQRAGSVGSAYIRRSSSGGGGMVLAFLAALAWFASKHGAR